MTNPASKPEPLSAEELQRRRESIRRGLVQANTAALVVIAVVVAFAVAAALAALHAERNASAARENEQRAQQSLWSASLAQAKAQRLTREMGQRVKSLAAIRVAARLNPTPELRTEAIAALALPDFEAEPFPLSYSSNSLSTAVDDRLEHYSAIDRQGNITVARVMDDRVMAKLSFPTTGSPSLVLSPGARFLAAKFGPQLKVWGLPEGQLLWETDHARPLGFELGPAFDRQGGLLAYPTDAQTVRVCDARSGQTRYESIVLPRPGALAFHPRTNWLAVACGEEARILDFASGKVIRQFSRRSRDLLQMAWSGDGRSLAGGCDDGLAYVWNAATGAERPFKGHTREGVRALLRPQGDLLVTMAWDRVLRVWDAASGEQLFRAEGCTPLGFGADGARLAVHSQSGIRIWRVHPARECKIFTAPAGDQAFSSVAFSPDQRYIAASSGTGLWLWNLDDPAHPARAGTEWTGAAHFRGTNQFLTTGHAGLLRWHLPAPDTPLPSQLAAPETLLRLSDRDMMSATFFADNERLLINVEENGYLYDFSKNTLAPFLEGHTGMDTLAVSKDGRWIASGCWFNTHTTASSTWVWSAANGEPVLKWGTPNSRPAFSPDSRWLVTSFPDHYQVRDTATWK
ncbi:MAG TPA: WD40 repeat domain-containing protein, partial [Verrucomicrobiae bacterium]|nr:WD40 repeat domain-containing protein [Verrucomicrobiae bacterium]